MPKLKIQIAYTPRNADGTPGEPVQLIRLDREGKHVDFSEETPHGYATDTVAAIELAKRYGVEVTRANKVGLISETVAADGHSVEERTLSIQLGELTPEQIERLLPDAEERFCTVPLAVAQVDEVTDEMVNADAEVQRQIGELEEAGEGYPLAQRNADEQRIKAAARQRLEEAAKARAIEAEQAKLQTIKTGHGLAAAEQRDPAGEETAREKALKAAAEHRVANPVESDVLRRAVTGETRQVAQFGQQGSAYRDKPIEWKTERDLIDTGRVYADYKGAQADLERVYKRMGLSKSLKKLRKAQQSRADEVNVIATVDRRGGEAAQNQQFVQGRLDQLAREADRRVGFETTLLGGVHAPAYFEDFDPDELMENPEFAGRARAAAEAEVDLTPNPADSYFAEGMANLDERRQIFQQAWTRLYGDRAGAYAEVRAQVAGQMGGAHDAHVAEWTRQELMRRLDFDPAGRVIVAPEMMAAKQREIAEAVQQAQQEPRQENITVTDFDGVEHELAVADYWGGADAGAVNAGAVQGLLERWRDAAPQPTEAEINRARERDVKAWQAILAGEAGDDENWQLPYRDANGALQHLQVSELQRDQLLDADSKIDPAKLAKLWDHDFEGINGFNGEQTPNIQAATTQLQQKLASLWRKQAFMHSLGYDISGRVIVTPVMMAAKRQEITEAVQQAQQDPRQANITVTDFNGVERQIPVAHCLAEVDPDAQPQPQPRAVDDAKIQTLLARLRDEVAPVDEGSLAAACQHDVAKWQGILAGAAGDGDNWQLPYRGANGEQQHLVITADQRGQLLAGDMGDEDRQPDPEKLAQLWQHDFSDAGLGGDFPAHEGIVDVQEATKQRLSVEPFVERARERDVTKWRSILDKELAEDQNSWQFPYRDVNGALRYLQVSEAQRAQLLDADNKTDPAKLAKLWDHDLGGMGQFGDDTPDFHAFAIQLYQRFATEEMGIAPNVRAYAAARAEHRFDAAIDEAAHQQFLRRPGVESSALLDAAEKELKVSHTARLQKKLAKLGTRGHLGGRADLALMAELRDYMRTQAGAQGVDAESGFGQLRAGEGGVEPAVADAQLDQLIKTVILENQNLIDWGADPRPSITDENKKALRDRLRTKAESFKAELEGDAKQAHLEKMRRDNPMVQFGDMRAPQRFNTLDATSDTWVDSYWQQQGRAQVRAELAENYYSQAFDAARDSSMADELKLLRDSHAHVAEAEQDALQAQRDQAFTSKEEYQKALAEEKRRALLEAQEASMHFDEKGVLRNKDGKDVLEEKFGKDFRKKFKAAVEQDKEVANFLEGLSNGGDMFSMLLLMFANFITSIRTSVRAGKFMTAAELRTDEGKAEYLFARRWDWGRGVDDKVMNEAFDLLAQSFVTDAQGKQSVDLTHLAETTPYAMQLACAVQALKAGLTSDQIKGLPGPVMERAQEIYKTWQDRSLAQASERSQKAAKRLGEQADEAPKAKRQRSSVYKQGERSAASFTGRKRKAEVERQQLGEAQEEPRIRRPRHG